MEQLSQITYIEKHQTLAGNTSFDFDIVLPEYYDSVSKILDCSLTPVCESVNVTGDKISVAGIGKIQLLYIGEDKKLYCYKNEQKYTRIFQTNNLNASACVDIDQTVSSMNFRALGPKRVSVKANIMVCIFPSELKFCNLIDENTDDNIETSKAVSDLYRPLALATRDIAVNGELTVDEIKDEIAEIIRAETVFQINEIKPIHNKIYLSGNCFVSFLAMTVNNTFVRSGRLSIPYSEILDINGIEENVQCYISNRINDTKIVVSEYKGTNQLSVNINVSVKVSAFSRNQVSYISDIFSTEKGIETTFSNIDIFRSIEKKNETITIAVESDAVSNNDFEIIDTWVDELTAVTAQSKDSDVSVVVSGNYKVLVKTGDGEINCLMRNFSKDISVAESFGKQEIESISLMVLSISSLRTSSKTIRTSMDISLDVTVYDMCKVNLLSDYKVTDETQCERIKGVILYFADKGENVWTIAKNNRISVERIMSYNSLNEYEIKNETMLILPNI